jgi:hypothetical protein
LDGWIDVVGWADAMQISVICDRRCCTIESQQNDAGLLSHFNERVLAKSGIFRFSLRANHKSVICDDFRVEQLRAHKTVLTPA